MSPVRKKSRLQVAKYDEPYTVFFEQWIRTYGSVVKMSRRESPSLASWVRFLMSAETLSHTSAILCDTEPVSALARARSLSHFSSQSSRISSVAISR